MKRFLILFDWFWLPAFLLLSVSWLFAPGLYHAHYGSLAVISSYEDVSRSWSWIFRANDVLAAAVLGAAVWRFRVLPRDRWLGLALVLIAGLSAIDGLFPIGCRAVCTAVEHFSWSLHDIESAVLAVVVALSGLLVFWRTRSWLSIIFIALQIGMAVAAVSGAASHQQLVVIEFVYELILVAWAAWLAYGFAPGRAISKPAQKRVRRVFMWLTVLSGVLVLAATAAHHHIFGPLLGLASLEPQVPWLAQHGVISGLLLLYIARQVGKGQRRAAVLMAVIVSSLLVSYALYRPRPILLGFSLLLLVALWMCSEAFGRNVGPPPLAVRLKDFTTVMLGVLAAACIVLAAALVTGHQQQLYRDVSRLYHRSKVPLARGERRVPERYETHLRQVTNTLGIGLIALLAWTIFRPSGRSHETGEADRERARRLLNRYSNSSEDFFKLWPPDKQYFWGADGFVAYKVAGTVAFALADPIASSAKRASLAMEFTEFCRKHGWRVCFLLVPEKSRKIYEPELKLFKIGASAVIGVDEFAEKTVREKWWRWQANRAAKAGYAYEALQPPHSTELLNELGAVSDAWLNRPGHTEQGFALGYFDQTYLQNCDVHTLREADGRLVAFANELPVFGRRTQRTVDLMRFLPEIDGAVSVLLMQVLKHWHEQQSANTFDLGFVPLAKLDSTLANIARRLAASRFAAAGLEQFKGKFQPTWQPNYIAYDGDILDLVVVVAALENALKPAKNN